MKKLLILLLFPSITFAQNMPDFGIGKVRIIEPDKTILAEIHPVSKNVSTNAEKIYYWYGSNAIHTTQGGYSGRLLDGLYTEFYLNKNLKEQGEFKKGLKQGVWKSWSESGTLIQSIAWNKGVLSGSFSIYEPTGRLKETGQYRDNILTGRLESYSGKDSGKVKCYKDGQLQPEIMHRTIWQRLHLVKKPPVRR